MKQMTNSEAIKELKLMRYNDANTGDMDRALEMAVEALQLNNNLTKVDNENDELVRKQDVIKMIQETKLSSGMTKARLLIKAQNLSVVQENIIRCKDCEKHGSIYCTMSEEFDDGTNPEDFCSYAENTCENTCEITRMSHAKDTIYRQAAIDALMAWEEDSFWDEECLIHRGEPYWVAPSDVIERIPSAQPEYVTFQLIQDIYDEIKKAECGDSYIVLEGETIVTDTAYALEGIEIFYELIKRRCKQ